MKNKKISFETYGDEKEKNGFLTKVWNKTIFPQMIKDKKEKKKWEREMKLKARKMAEPEIEKKLIEKYKEDEINKMIGKKKDKMKNFGEKLAKGFSLEGSGAGKKDIGAMMGFGATNKKDIGEMMSFSKKNNKTKKRKKTFKEKEYDFEDKIKKLLS